MTKNKTRQLNILFSDEIFQEIEKEAEILGLNVGSFARMLILQQLRKEKAL